MSDTFRYLVTPNVDHIIRLSQEPSLYGPLYNRAWISVCDSKILELLAKFSGINLLTLPGSDLTKILFENVISRNDKINVIGANEEILDKVKSRYSLQYIKLYTPYGLAKQTGCHSCHSKIYIGQPARYSFICVGSPQQEMIATACLNRGDCTGLGLCVGASLEF